MISVFIVHPEPLVCQVLADLFNKETDIEFCCFAANVSDAIKRIQDCNVVLAGTSLPGIGSLEFLKTITSLNPRVRVLMMGKVESEEALIRYIEAGASGYILNQDATHEMLEKIRAAYEGKALISPQLAARLMARICELFTMQSTFGSQVNELFELTPRERDVLDMLRQGLTNREIAEHLVVEVGTIKNHVHNILKKLELNSRRDLVDLEPVGRGGRDTGMRM